MADTRDEFPCCLVGQQVPGFGRIDSVGTCFDPFAAPVQFVGEDGVRFYGVCFRSNELYRPLHIRDYSWNKTVAKSATMPTVHRDGMRLSIQIMDGSTIKVAFVTIGFFGSFELGEFRAVGY